MKKIIIVLGGLLLSTLSYSQVFRLNTTGYHITSYVNEVIYAKGHKYLGTRKSLGRTTDGIVDWGYSILSPNQCLHDNSRYRDMELLNNGSLTGLFYHNESCVSNQSVFLMLDSTGNVLVDKRFATGLSLFQGGIIEKDSLVHVYAMHILPGLTKDGLVHYTFDYQGSQIDSVSRLTELWYGGYAGFPGFTVYGDSLLIPVSKYLGGAASAHELVLTDFELGENPRTIFSDSVNGITSWKKYDDTLAFILFRGNHFGYRSGIGRVDLNGNNVITDTCDVGTSIEYGDLLKMGKYYIVTEYNHLANEDYKKLTIFDMKLNIVYKEDVSHNLNEAQFIKTSDSTFILYDETWTYEYTINFDSVLEYISGIKNPFAKSTLNVSVFPNPTTNTVTVQFPKSTETQVSLYNISGVRIAQKQVANTSSTNFDLSALPKGVYFIQVQTPTQTGTVKIIRD